MDLGNGMTAARLLLLLLAPLSCQSADTDRRPALQRLSDDLFRNYNKNVRPTPVAAGKPLSVYFDLLAHQLVDVVSYVLALGLGTGSIRF